MPKLQTIINRLQRVDLERIMLMAARKEIHFAYFLNTQDQLYAQGIDSDGNQIGEYSIFTIFAKEKKGEEWDHITLHDTGDFYKGWFANTQKFPIMFSSRDVKTSELVERYGESIFGLTRENEDKFAEYIKPFAKQRCAEEIKKVFR